MQMEKEEDDRRIRLAVSGALTIDAMEALHSRLLAEQKTGKDIRILLGKVDACDIYGVQLLISACTPSGIHTGKTVMEDMPAHMAAYCRRIGFDTETVL
ncbi:MAG: STAS domain-containing protein [Thermodesulfobacteriota bacterium]